MHNSVFLGFDFGMRFVGVAVGQMLTLTAQPLTVIKAKDGIPDWTMVEALIQEWGAKQLVVGVPYNMDGTEQNTTFAARKFAHRLADKFKLPVHQADERLTTKAAQSALQTSKQKQTQRMDSYAAKLILESWMRQQKEEAND